MSFQKSKIISIIILITFSFQFVMCGNYTEFKNETSSVEEDVSNLQLDKDFEKENPKKEDTKTDKEKIYDKSEGLIPKKITLYGEQGLLIESGTTIHYGDLASKKDIIINDGVNIDGNIVISKNITIGKKSLILGNVLYGGDLEIGDGSSILGREFSGSLGDIQLEEREVIDEAMDAGAKEVRFNRPIPFYVDNFLEFNVGGEVPLGYYDREKAAWVPYNNGRVVAILNEVDGMAELDIDGDGEINSPEELNELSITDEERVKLAELYDPGKSIWRVLIPHLTPWNCNWPYCPPLNAVAPELDYAEYKSTLEEEQNTCVGGSIIACESQTLGEVFGIHGTSYDLHYSSGKILSNYSIIIPITGDEIPNGVKSIELEIEIEGRRFQETFPLEVGLNHTYRFEWDGRDAYGREVNGAKTAKIKVGYVYDAVYRTPERGRGFSEFARSLTPISGNRAR